MPSEQNQGFIYPGLLAYRYTFWRFANLAFRQLMISDSFCNGENPKRKNFNSRLWHFRSVFPKDGAITDTFLIPASEEFQII